MSTKVHQSGWAGLENVHVDIDIERSWSWSAQKLKPFIKKVIDDFESDEETMETEQSGPMPIFNMKNLLTSPFVHLSDEIEEEQ